VTSFRTLGAACSSVQRPMRRIFPWRTPDRARRGRDRRGEGCRRAGGAGTPRGLDRCRLRPRSGAVVGGVSAERGWFPVTVSGRLDLTDGVPPCRPIGRPAHRRLEHPGICLQMTGTVVRLPTEGRDCLHIAGTGQQLTGTDSPPPSHTTLGTPGQRLPLPTLIRDRRRLRRRAAQPPCPSTSKFSPKEGADLQGLTSLADDRVGPPAAPVPRVWRLKGWQGQFHRGRIRRRRTAVCPWGRR
jgi:hypothetical protein